MFSVDLPYEIGTFVKVVDPKFERKEPIYCGTVAAYTVCSQTDYCIWVSGYKEACTGEYLPEEVIPMTDEEIQELKKQRGE